MAARSPPLILRSLSTSLLVHVSAKANDQARRISHAGFAAPDSQVRYRNLTVRQEDADPRDRKEASRHRRGKPRPVWPLQGQGVDGLREVAAEQAERQADPRVRDHA